MITPSDRTYLAAVLVAVLALHAVLVAAYFVPVVGGTDDNGFHVAARLLERDSRIHQTPPDDLAHVGRMWVMTDDGTFYPKYPPLYPALAAALMRAFGDIGGLMVSPILGWLVVLGVYLLARLRGVSRLAAVLGATTMALLPLANGFAIAQVSHATSLALLTWSYVAFFGALERSEGSRRLLLLVVSGLLLGYTAGVRYTNLLLVLPGLFWLLTDRTSGWMTRLAAWLGGWSVPCLAVGLYHWQAFGSPLRTAYSLTEEQGGFALSYLVQNLRIYAATVPVELLGPMTILALLGWLVVWRRGRREGFFYLVWGLPLLLTYLAYYWAPEDHARSYLRFLLPTVIPAIVLATILLTEVLERIDRPRDRRAVVAVVLLCQGFWGLFATLGQMELIYGRNEMTRNRIDFVRRNAPAGSVVIGGLELLDALDYYREYDLYLTDLFDRGLLETRLQRTLVAGPDSLQAARAELLMQRLLEVEPSVHRERIERIVDGPLAEGRAVFLAGPGHTLESFKRFAQQRYRTRHVAGQAPRPAEHRLFEPGRTVSRADPSRRMIAPIHVWQIRANRTGE